MSRARAIVVYLFVLLAEGGLVYMAKEPTVCTGTSYIMWLAGGSKLETVPRVRQLAHLSAGVICLLACIGLLLLAIDLFGGKSKGLLKFAYLFMAVYSLLQIAVCIMLWTTTGRINTIERRTNLIVFLVAHCIMVAVLLLYILRELGLMRFIDKLSAVLLLVVIGQVVTNGLLMPHSNVGWSLLYGLITALPTIAIFVFEAFILEASIRRNR